MSITASVRRAWALALGLAMVAAGAGATHHDQEKGHDHASQAAAPAMSAEQEAMMAAWMKAMTPGPAHAWMAAKAGSWEGTVTSWMDPAQPPESNPAKVERTMVLGGRVMQERWHSTMMGGPFEGIGMAGHDNVTGKDWSLWFDTAMTGFLLSEGSCDQAKATCEYVGSMVDPTTGQPAKVRSKTWWPSADEERTEMYMPGPDGKEWKNMEITIRRVKK